MSIKHFFKQNSRNPLFRVLSKFGLSINRIYENKNYDISSNGEMRVLQALGEITPKVIFDVGANKGDYTCLAKKLHPDADIWSFEPVERPFDQLRQLSISLTGVKPYKLGLGKSMGTAMIFLYEDDAHSSMVSIEGMNRIISDQCEVDMITGDHFMDQHEVDQIDLLKIDVEGSELDVIQGFGQAFACKKIRACQFEYGYANISSHALLVDFYNFFSKRGYRIGKIYPKYVDFRTYHVKQEDFLGANYLAVESSQTGLITKLSLQ